MSKIDKIGTRKTRVYTDQRNDLCVQYRDTVVARRYLNGAVELNSGGWRTATTKMRMNQALYQWARRYIRYSVIQRKGEWYVSTCDLRTAEHGKPIPFFDGIVLS
jgi:hypothetical protein